MAVDSGFLGKVKTSLRISYTNTNIDNQISDLIEEAILDLTKTADISTFTTANADPMQSGAVVAYVSYKWYSDEKYLAIYNDMKQKMALSGHYNTIGVQANEEQNSSD